MARGTVSLLLDARERFLSDGIADDCVRPEIHASWRRSRVSGVCADKVPDIHVDAYDLQSRLLRAAAPVLDRLADQISDALVSIILTDENARILDRRVGVGSLTDAVDGVLAVPGAHFSEEVVGTNGLGSTAETRRPFVVRGGEHFSEILRQFTCVGVPLTHQITGRVEGVLDMTSGSDEANPLMLPMVLEAARNIQRRLYESASAVERAMLEQFLAVTRRSSCPVLSVGEHLVITNAAAARMLHPADHAILWERVAVIGAGERHHSELVLSNGSLHRLEIRPVSHDGEMIGAIVELKLTPPGSRPEPPAARLTGLVGSTPPWRSLCEQVIAVAGSALNVAFLGENGAGKRTVSRALYEMSGRGGPIEELDAALAVVDQISWLRQARAARNAAVLIVRHAQLLSAECAAALAAIMDESPARTIVTADPHWPETAPRMLVDRFSVRLTVPPLRERRDDVVALTSELVRRRSLDREVRFSSASLQTLIRSPWPGNVSELEAVVSNVLARGRVGDITVDDLPVEYRTPSCVRELSTIERVERDAIRQALSEHHGNKKLAAEHLGVSRSTVYRKLRAYGIELDGTTY